MEKSKLEKLLSRPILIPALLAILSVVFIIVAMLKVVNDVEKYTAKEHASHVINTVAVLRNFYSTQLLANLKKKHDVVVSPNYLDNPGEMPPPARLAIDFAKVLSSSDENIKVRLISHYPFPWRLKTEGKDFDAFELEALDYLAKHSDQTYSKVVQEKGEKFLRYAEPVLMKESCVGCHNSHPESPKTDWEKGDVRGISEVSIRLTTLDKKIHTQILLSFIIVSSLLTLSLIMLHFSMKGMKKALKIAQNKAEELDQMNKNLENIVDERTQQLKDKNEALETSLEELKQAQETIVMQDKMASLGQMTAGIAHEIKNPLNFIKNFSELSKDLSQDVKALIQELLAKPDDKSLQEELIELIDSLHSNSNKIADHSMRVDNIVKSMLMHSRDSSSDAQMVDVNELVKQTYNLAHHGQQIGSKDKQVEAVFDFAEVGQAQLYPNELGRVLLNIINNAIYAVVDFATEQGPDYVPTITLSTERTNDKIIIKIRDNGKGITEENIQSIFQPFFTTKPTNIGTGLGLSLSYDIVTKLHQGELTVNSNVGEYAEFVITIPVILSES